MTLCADSVACDRKKELLFLFGKCVCWFIIEYYKFISGGRISLFALLQCSTWITAQQMLLLLFTNPIALKFEVFRLQNANVRLMLIKSKTCTHILFLVILFQFLHFISLIPFACNDEKEIRETFISLLEFSDLKARIIFIEHVTRNVFIQSVT